MGRHKNHYTVYLRETGERLVAGTDTKCAWVLGYANADSFRAIASKMRRGVLKKYVVIVDTAPHHEEETEVGEMAAGWNRGKAQKYYTVYRRKTDEIVTCGTAAECTKALGYANKGSFLSIVSKSRKGKPGKYEFIVDDNPYDEETEVANG